MKKLLDCFCHGSRLRAMLALSSGLTLAALSPVAAQTVSGTGTSGNLPLWTGSHSIGNSIVIQKNGNIGIGASNPAAKLLVVGGDSNTAAFTAVSPNIGVIGNHTSTNGNDAGVRGSTNSTADNANAILGIVVATNPGYGSAAVRGENRGTESYGYGVYGSQNGYGYGVYGTSSDGYGVYGSGSTGVYGSGSYYGLYGSGGTYGVYSSGSTYGVYGTGYYGIYGFGTSNGYGLYGTSTNGFGVQGTSTNSVGVAGNSSGSNALQGVSGSGPGLFAQSTSGSGVDGRSTSGNGVQGISKDGTGVLGQSTGSGYAGYFYGNVYVSGNLGKATGSFKIDDPLDPANKYLSHSFVESPDMMNVYNGNVTLDRKGEATVRMPAYFKVLNRDFRYQLTCIGRFAPVYVADEVKGNAFRIAGGKPGTKVSWQVTGIRQDAYANAHRIEVETDKPAEEIGYYLHPELYGQPESKAVSRVSPGAPAEVTAVAAK